jgi:hypothetical protein
MANAKRETDCCSISCFISYTFVFTVQSASWVRFNGTCVATVEGIGTLTLNASVNEMDYEDGTILKVNVAGVESIYGAKVVLSGATRTGNYSFNGDMVNPDDVRLKIVSSDGFIYFDANLADSHLFKVTMFVWLNQFWTPITLILNLYNIVLNTDAVILHDIQELSAYLAASNVMD